MDDALDIGYREATVFIDDVSKILGDPIHHESISADRLQVLTDFKAAALETGMGPDGFARLTLAPGANMVDGMREVTRVMQAYLRGECTEFVEDFNEHNDGR